MIFSCPKEPFPQQFTFTVEIESYNWDGELTVKVNGETKFNAYLPEQPPVLNVVQGDNISVVLLPGNGEAYIRSYSGLNDVDADDSYVAGTVAGNVHIIVSADPPVTR